MVRSDLLSAVSWALLPAAALLGAPSTVLALAVVFVASASFAFFEGANLGALPALAGRDRIGQANAALWGFVGVIDLLAPMIAGIAWTVTGPSTLIAADALSFVASALLVAGIRRPLSDRPSGAPTPFSWRLVTAEVREGLRWLWQHPGLRPTTIVVTVQSVAGGGFIALVVPWADRHLGIGTSGWRFGVLLAAWGAARVHCARSTRTGGLFRFGSSRFGLVGKGILGRNMSVVAG